MQEYLSMQGQAKSKSWLCSSLNGRSAARGVSVASIGAGTAPAVVVRQIAHGERVAELVREVGRAHLPFRRS